MPSFEYTGPCPVPGEDGVLVHPGDVAEYDAEPGWGAWRLLPADEQEPEASPKPAATPAASPAPAAPAATTATPAATPASSAPADGKQA